MRMYMNILGWKMRLGNSAHMAPQDRHVLLVKLITGLPSLKLTEVALSYMNGDRHVNLDQGI